jgi:multiple sugar transport system permease protein
MVTTSTAGTQLRRSMWLRQRGAMAWRRGEAPLVMLLPSSAVFIAVVLYPLISGMYLSLTETNPTTLESRFVGLQNYGHMLADAAFWTSLRVTVTYAMTTVLVELPLALGIALLLNEDIRGRWVYRGLLLLPWVMPNVAAAVIWGWLLSADYGLINFYLKSLGVIPQYIAWLARSDLALPSTIAVGIWKGLPFSTVVLLAGLQTIGRELYEAAEVDGAGALQRLRHIVVPALVPMMVLVVVLRFTWSFNTFDTVYVMTGGGPGWATYLLSIYMYLTAFSFRELGYGSALATVMLVILVALAGAFIRASSRSAD